MNLNLFSKIRQPGILFALVCVSMLSACKPKPSDIVYGQDACRFCVMGIVDKQYGAEIVTKKIYKLEENEHPYATKSEKETKVVRDGTDVHIYMTMIRSHFSPDNIEGVKQGDKVYFHVTNLEQDYDVPHGISVIGANTSELLIMPGQTETFIWEPKQVGVWPFYCTDFCSALHQEMQGYVRVSATDSDIELSWSLDGE